MAEFDLHLTEPGLWVQRTTGRDFSGRPALFLDRDGTIMLDTGYPKDPAEVALRAPILPVIRAANRVDIPTIIVSNQSGIARGLLGWSDFAAVNARLLYLLALENCRIDLVIACAYHAEGQGDLGIGDHPMRKPNPGMLKLAGDMLRLDLGLSLIVGDKDDDMEAGRRAGLRQGWLVGGAQAAESREFAVLPLSSGGERLCEVIAALAD